MVLYVPVSVTGARSVETVLVVSSSWGSVRFDVSPLDPGDHVIPVTLPRRLAPGRYDTVVEINRPATQPETNDDNNVATLTVTVAPPGLWLIFAIAAGVALLAGGTWLVRRPAPEAAGAPAIPEIQFRPAPGASRSVISRRTPGTSDPFVVAVRPRLGNSGR